MNISNSVKKWRAQDEDDKFMTDIFALRIQDIDNRIKIMTRYIRYTPLNNEKKADIMRYMQDCYQNRSDYRTKIKFCRTYGSWEQEQQAAEDREGFHVETENPSRRELDKLREENEQNKEDITRNERLDFVGTVKQNPYLVRGGIPDL